MSRQKSQYWRQKPILYFDENFPQQVIEAAMVGGVLKKYFRLYSVSDFHNQGKDDRFQLEFCKSKGFVLVTLDKDFMDDRKYPIQNLPGIIRIAAAKNDNVKILSRLMELTDFLSGMPFPKEFMRDCKFQVSTEGCIMRGRHVRTRNIENVVVKPGDTIREIAKAFGLVE